MKNIRFIVTFLIIQTALSIFAFAQVPTGPVKIALIETEAFYDEKIGITKLVTATKQLNAEFAAQIKALEDGGAKLQSIAKEIETLPRQTQVQQNAIAAKQEEGERLQRELNYKKTELENAIAKRRAVLIAPISQDIGKGIDEFAKKNGYGAIFDIGKMAESGVLLFLAETANVTKEFITFYNARPATAATTAKP